MILLAILTPPLHLLAADQLHSARVAGYASMADSLVEAAPIADGVKGAFRTVRTIIHKVAH